MANGIKLKTPANKGIHQLAASLLNETAKEVKRLGNEEDKEALHDFRVSVRRLHNFLRTYQDFLTKNKWQECFRQLISDSNKDRDSEVHLLWLNKQAQNEELLDKVRQGVSLMLEHLNNTPTTTPNKINLYNSFDSIAKDFEKYLKKVKLKAKKVSFAQVTAKLIQTQAKKLKSEFEDANNELDKIKIHKARLKVKTLRYTIEPLQKELESAKELVPHLKNSQDILGEINDLQILEIGITQRIKNLTNNWQESLTLSALSNVNPDELKYDLQELEQCQHLAALLNHNYKEQQVLLDSFKEWLVEAENTFWPKLEELVKSLKI